MMRKHEIRFLALLFVSVARTTEGFVIPSASHLSLSFKPSLFPSSPLSRTCTQPPAACPITQSRNQGPYTPAQESLKGQTIVITGGSSGLGLESAKRLAVGGASIILTVRSETKGQEAVEQVVRYLDNKNIVNRPEISYKLLDLDNLNSVRKVAEIFGDVSTIDVLLNNAGVMALPKMELTVDGYEKQIQSNHLGHFLLTALLVPKLASNARIINVSSSAHQIPAATGLRTGDELWRPDSFEYAAWEVYGQSKLANIHFTKELQRRALRAGMDWTATCLHPGVVATDLGRYIFGDFSANQSFLTSALSNVFSSFLKTPEEGATTQIWLAARADQDVQMDVRGEYISDCKVQSLPGFATDPVASERLWKESEHKAQIEFPIVQKAEQIAE